jgi:Uma2 family endonuclease
MATTSVGRRCSVEEYLALEECAEHKSEYRDGLVVAIDVSPYQHSLISAKVLCAIHSSMRGTSFEITGSNCRVAIKTRRLYVYPDATIVCGSPQFDPADKNKTTIINPTLLVEVLSEGTEAYDRGDKFDAFRDLPTLKEYVIVASSRPLIESFFRQDDGTWLLSYARGGEGSPVAGKLLLRSIGLELDLAEVYERVEFEPPGSTAPADPG